ncbi:hypothetical protein PENARI_c118G00149 [Penicillium arizonense]|uniref:Transcription factor domain-containing protein n=1 Tax=Penicillium arizonense TaxID=1835702 RepID=A0A1F5L0D8_PENAI|nr:hypothetical protein PENARI_c131G00100 [Penicillium arizonense]XP_022482197.1 hypothetical protein PENARI_c126G10373 [Penicillium arizonense]XP_022482202.1 hypothetical protein PENARI_c125G07657 [Penicillium arizonense]XP_022482230.1 hypothetical protein PENARI_c118G00149 [Penicillium arizonense]OGE46708.1 hypothetical protein PENARI_c131G00100 [Penicillium arizonense]OGE46729.1 hypothetical protein PENARI_c126G10373 [Penicillium arizonense]OGE46734.1 hypothetical protein PENARI_c125G07657
MAVADVGEIGYNFRLVSTTPPMATTIQEQPRNLKSMASGPSQSTEMMKSVSMADTPDENHQASVGSMLNLNAQLSTPWPPFDFESMQFAEDNIPDDFWSYPTEIPGSSLPWNGDVTHLPEFEPTNSEIFNAIQPPPTRSLNSVQTSTSDQSVSGHLDIIQHITEYESSASAPSVQSKSSSSSESKWLDSFNEEERSMSVNLDNRLYSPSHLIFGHTFMVGLGHQIRTDSSSLCQEMLEHLREYPGLILDRDFWSPFVHHRLYRCSLGGMAPPMADALACVGAYASTVGSNSGLVDRMISQEREKLVRNFHSYTDTPEFCLAAMHAVCIYQTIGLFGDSFLPAAVKEAVFSNGSEERRQEFERSAELYSSFLLKMARRLSSVHSKALQIHHEDENDWNQWKFMESLRRNFFFVHIINILDSQARKLNESYFEPLNDNMILRLPLPAPERMWRACSAEEWMIARAQTLGPSIPPKSPGSGGEPSLRTLGHVLQAVHAGKVNVASLLPLNRMILASAIISPPGAASF